MDIHILESACALVATVKNILVGVGVEAVDMHMRATLTEVTPTTPAASYHPRLLICAWGKS